MSRTPAFSSIYILQMSNSEQIQILNFGKLAFWALCSRSPRPHEITGTRLGLTHSLTHKRQVLSDGIIPGIIHFRENS